jgi:hypothetical protein
MTDPTPDGVTPEETPPADTKAPTAEDVARLTAALDKERELRKAAEKTARERENERRASMEEGERALLEAEERGRSAVRTEYGQRLARTEFLAEAARRNPGYDATAILDDLNLARYIGEDGEPQSKAIAAAVERLVPAATSNGIPRPDPSQGPRATPAADSDERQFARALFGRD